MHYLSHLLPPLPVAAKLHQQYHVVEQSSTAGATSISRNILITVYRGVTLLQVEIGVSRSMPGDEASLIFGRLQMEAKDMKGQIYQSSVQQLACNGKSLAAYTFDFVSRDIFEQYFGQDSVLTRISRLKWPFLLRPIVTTHANTISWDIHLIVPPHLKKDASLIRQYREKNVTEKLNDNLTIQDLDTIKNFCTDGATKTNLKMKTFLNETSPDFCTLFNPGSLLRDYELFLYATEVEYTSAGNRLESLLTQLYG